MTQELETTVTVKLLFNNVANLVGVAIHFVALEALAFT
jgi:hypothetical protein